jgi:hypothetical protein
MGAAIVDLVEKAYLQIVAPQGDAELEDLRFRDGSSHAIVGGADLA